VATLLGARLVESDPGIGLDQGADVAGALLVASALMLGVYTIVEATDVGWGSARTWGLGAFAVLLLGGFLIRQTRAAQPLVPLELFRSRNVSGANIVQGLMMAGLFGVFFLGALYMQRVLDYDPIQTGLAFLPVAVVIAVFGARLTPELNTRFGARTMLMIGLTLIVGGLLLFARVPVGAARYAIDMLPAMVLLGVGFGLTFPATMTLGMCGATASDAGLVSGLVQTTSQVGGSLGLAVLATLSTSQTNHLLAGGESAATALTAGYHLGFVVGASLVAGAVVVAVTVLRSESTDMPQTAGDLEHAV
jgi:hypothetical protein